MGRCAGVGGVEAPDARNIAGQFQDSAIVDLVQHGNRGFSEPDRRVVDCWLRLFNYIGVRWEGRKGPRVAGPWRVPDQPCEFRIWQRELDDSRLSCVSTKRGATTRPVTPPGPGTTAILVERS